VKNPLRPYRRNYTDVPPDAPSAPVSFRLGADVLRRLNAEARRRQMSRNLLVETLLDKALQPGGKASKTAEAGHADILG
jgi:hypothetical protein